MPYESQLINKIFFPKKKVLILLLIVKIILKQHQTQYENHKKTTIGTDGIKSQLN